MIAHTATRLFAASTGVVDVPRNRFKSSLVLCWRLTALMVCFGIWGISAEPIFAQTNVTFTVSSNSDDAAQTTGGTMYVNAVDSYMSEYQGYRFQNVTIPTGATITSATLEVIAYGSGTASFSVDVLAEDADNPSTFTSSANNISSRSMTSAQTLWSASSGSFTDGVSFTSPNFASSIQEVIDRSGWSSGNSLVLITTPNSGDKGISQRDRGSSYAPQLHVTYTTSSASNGKTVLLVTAGSSLTSEESARQSQFESWGYTVNTIEDSDSQSNFDTAMAGADVVYVPQSVSVSSLDYKLRTASIGVVHEGISSLDDNVGWTTSSGYNANTSQTMTITDNTHPVTNGLSTGTISIYSSSTGSYGAQINGTLASGAQQLGTNLGINSGLPSLVVFEKDATLANTYNSNSTASGRRVHLPFGGFGTFGWSNLTSNSLTMIQNSLDWASISLNGKSVLMITVSSSLTSEESTRKGVIESWGYTVTTIEDSATQSAYNTALAGVDLVYVSEEIISSDVGYKLRETTLGVVFDEDALSDEFGFATSTSNISDHTTFTVTDNGHYITSPYPTGALSYASPATNVKYLSGTLASGLQVLGNWTSSPGLAVVNPGDTLVNSYNGSDVAFGRRVGFIHGGAFSWSNLTADGETLFQRAFEWASSFDGLVGHWKLDETSGSIAADSSGNGNDGTLVGSPTWTSDAARTGGLAFDYTDGNDYVEIPSSTILDDIQEGSYSLATWFKPSSVPPQTGSDNLSGYGLIKKRNSSLGLHYSHIIGFQFNHYADEGSGAVQQAVTASTYRPGAWHHVVATVDQAAGEVKMYVNGEHVATNTFIAGSPGVDYGTQQWRLGISNPGGSSSERPAHGIQDDARIYDRALSPAEVAELYGLIGHWKLDENSGTVATDSSGIGNDGTYQGGAAPGGSGPYPGTGANAAEFDGTSGDKIALPTMDYDFSDGLTMAVWYNADAISGTYTDFFSLSNGSLIDDIWFGLDNAQGLDLFLSDTAGGAAFSGLIEGSGTETLGKWHHAVAVIDSNGDATLYRNGQVVATGNVGLPREVARTQNGIGETSFSHTIDGRLFDARIYNRPLSPAEVAEIYGLVGHWKLDENSGSTATDSSLVGNDGNYWNGSAPGGTGPYPGEGANAAEVDGTTAHVGMYPVQEYDEITETISVVAWVNFDTALADQTQQEKILHQENYASNLGFALIADQPYGDRLIFRVHNGSSHGSATWTNPGIEGGKWHHVVGTYDGTTVKLYVDAELVASVNFVSSTIAPNPQDNLAIGTQLDGRVFDVRLYNRAISEIEIAELYGLVGHWKFDEGSGTTIADSTGFGNDASFNTGTPAWIDGIYGSAIEFDGTNDAITGSSHDPSAKGAVAFWMRSDGPPAARQRPWGLGADFETWQDTDGLVSMDVSTDGFQGGFITTDPLDEADRWYHIVALYDSADESYEIYVNGELHKSGTSTWDIAKQAANQLSFGTRTGSTQRFSGAIDDFRIYNRWLSVAEVNDLYGRLAYWKLDETSGSVAVDSTEHSNDATYSGGPTLGANGAFTPTTGTAVELDGSSEYLDTNKSLVNGLSAFTMMGWVRVDSLTPDQSFFGQKDLIELGIDNSNGQLYFYTANGGATSAFNELIPSKWTHVAVTGDGTNLKIYVNGTENTSGGSATASYGSNTNDFQLGQGVMNGVTDYLDGRLDEVQIFDRALKPEEIFFIYKGGRPAGIRILRWVEAR